MQPEETPPSPSTLSVAPDHQLDLRFYSQTCFLRKIEAEKNEERTESFFLTDLAPLSSTKVYPEYMGCWGQRTIRSYWRNYFEQTDGLVWVVDSSDLRMLDDCKFELHNLLKEERLLGASLLILAHKQDVQGTLSPHEIAKVLSLEALDKTLHWEIVGCSAYTGAGLLEGFDRLVQDIASRIYMLD